MHWGEEMAGIRVWVDGQVVQEGGGDTRWYPGSVVRVVMGRGWWV